MTLKTSSLSFLLVAVIIIVFCISSFAQDKIYKKDGTEIDAKVTSIGRLMVWYKRTDNLNGPDYSINKRDIAIIIYPDGKTSVFFGADKTLPGTDRVTDKGKPEAHATDTPFVRSPNYHGRKNIFSITPVAYTQSLDGTINDFGVGLSYERLLDEKGTISFNIPVMLFVSSSKDYSNSIVTNNGIGGIANYSTYNSFWFMPGIKIYTGPDTRKVRLAFGTSLFCMFGSEPYGVYENSSTYGAINYPFSTRNYAMYGVMATGSVSLMTAIHVRLALDLAAGMPVSDDRYLNVYGTPAQVLSPFIQVGFKVGYCY